MGRTQVKSVDGGESSLYCTNKRETFYLDSFLHPRRLTTLQNGLECFFFVCFFFGETVTSSMSTNFFTGKNLDKICN